MKYIFISLFITLIFTSCSKNTIEVQRVEVIKKVYISSNKINKDNLYDLKIYPQNAQTYTKNIKPLNKELQERLYKEFFKNYFNPWNIDTLTLSKKEASWGKIYQNSTVYAENYRKISKIWFDKIIDLAAMDRFNTLKQKAITVRNSNLKVFPTNKPIFKKYNQAGEGFPFDYNQNTSININTPLFISHYSKDRGWAYVESSYASGWISVQDIATINKKIIKGFMQSKAYYVAIKDNFPLYKSGVFKDYIKLGTIFPILREKVVTVIRDNNGKGYLSRVDKNKNIVKFPIIFNKNNLNLVINELINKPYGWGGLFGNRDCSLLTKDLLTPFAFPLQRNSFAQTRSGEYISLKDKTDQQKKDIIKQKGIPFLSLIYIKGHIALYIGIYKGEPMIFHSTWGVKTIKDNIQGRYIIGKSIISSLDLGKELDIYDEKRNILHKIQGLVILK